MYIRYNKIGSIINVSSHNNSTRYNITRFINNYKVVLVDARLHTRKKVISLTVCSEEYHYNDFIYVIDMNEITIRYMDNNVKCELIISSESLETDFCVWCEDNLELYWHYKHNDDLILHMIMNETSINNY